MFLCTNNSQLQLLEPSFQCIHISFSISPPNMDWLRKFLLQNLPGKDFAPCKYRNQAGYNPSVHVPCTSVSASNNIFQVNGVGNNEAVLNLSWKEKQRFEFLTAEKRLRRNLLKHSWIAAVHNTAWNKGQRGRKCIKELKVSITGSYQHIQSIYLPSEVLLSRVFTLLGMKKPNHSKATWFNILSLSICLIQQIWSNYTSSKANILPIETSFMLSTRDVESRISILKWKF